MKENKKLCKISENKMVCGVCTGIASYFNVDVTVVRLIFSFLAITGSGVALYLVAAFLMPSEEGSEKTVSPEEGHEEPEDSNEA